MELPGSQFTFHLLLLLLVAPRGCAGAAAVLRTRDDASSLCLKLHISGSGPSWCEFVGTINSAPFFKYSCKSQMAKPINFLGMEENDTEAWNQRCEHLKELVEELRKALLDYKQNISKARRDSLSLQVHIMCQQESNGCHSTFCEFHINGQMCLHLDLKNKSWMEFHPGCRLLKETLESDRYVTNLFVLVLNGDCMKSLNQSAVLDTKAAPTMASVMTTVPAPSKGMIIKHNNIALILTPIFCLIPFGICAARYGGTGNRRYCSKSPESVV
ncbi:UL16-binding protein 6 isoform X2 [Desmodus rotundus]|uniref:UL16-binding protein 6 isoform X2 n=1 Tax=Desmodus rotundus TaxID=9430 RepID=UPI001E1BE386|nr:UL16-binding protein 6 isoform X2 [Desmodus rotundus]